MVSGCRCRCVGGNIFEGAETRDGAFVRADLSPLRCQRLNRQNGSARDGLVLVTVKKIPCRAEALLRMTPLKRLVCPRARTHVPTLFLAVSCAPRSTLIC